MFEKYTFEAMRDEMLDEVSGDLDKREGAIIYDTLSKTALPMAEMYSNLDVFLDLVFADTADGEYLERRAAEFGVYRNPATATIRKGIFQDTNSLPMNIPIGSRYSLEGVNFRIIEKIQEGQYRLVAEVVGELGNLSWGTIVPLEPMDGLGSAELVDILKPGVEKESDESLLRRLQIRVQKQATSGNVYHYEQWALSVSGIGGARVIPTWDGPGTVKVVLINNEKKPVTSEVAEEVYRYIETERPIGAIVTVVPAKALDVNVTANLTLAEGYTLEEATEQFTSALNTYIGSLAFTDDLIRYSRIATLLIDVPPILDYENLLVNGQTANIQTAIDTVGVAGTVVFT